MAESKSTFQILNNLQYLVGIPLLLITLILLFVGWQYFRREQRITILTRQRGVADSSSSTGASIATSKVWSWRYYMVAAMLVALLWWQWDWVTGLGFWEAAELALRDLLEFFEGAGRNRGPAYVLILVGLIALFLFGLLGVLSKDEGVTRWTPLCLLGLVVLVALVFL